jgi:hypothetical protein
MLKMGFSFQQSSLLESFVVILDRANCVAKAAAGNICKINTFHMLLSLGSTNMPKNIKPVFVEENTSDTLNTTD